MNFTKKAFWLTIATSFLGALCCAPLRADDLTGQVKKAVQESTLDQAGTHPFHLKATFAPSRERDNNSGRTGDMEFWWQSPTRWRREVRSPEFHQILIVDGGREWQKNDGDYFPEWLRELAAAIVRPVPLPMDVLLQRVRTAEVRHLRSPVTTSNGKPRFEQTNIEWEPSGAPGDVQSNGKGYLTLLNGSLAHTLGPGWSGSYRDLRNFHGRMAAYTVASGYVEVTAKVSILEDLTAVPDGFFDADAPGQDGNPIRTVVLDEAELRKNLLPSGKPFTWPALMDGPLEGMVGTRVVLDRNGKIREMTPPIGNNPGVRDAAEQGFRAMQFQPVMRDGAPVQAVGPLSVPFKTVRPPGVETLDSAGNYFERGRRASFLAAGAKAPYVLRAEFQADMQGGVQSGRYEDIWLGENEWKREAWLGSSHLVRSQVGEQRYLLAEGADGVVLRMVMIAMEPIPAGDTMTESDWTVRRDTLQDIKSIRVSRGAQAYWFEESGRLLKCFVNGFEIRRSEVTPYGGVQVARRTDLLNKDKVAMRISVNEIAAPGSISSESFKIKNHEWQRAFTAEVR